MRRLTIPALALLLLLAGALPSRAQTGRELFQQALVMERSQGDLKGAISLYERIVREFATDRSLTASALLQLGECYEKQGSAQARQAYQRVVTEFADQGDLAAQARTRLAALQGEAAPPLKGPVARLIFTSQNPADRVFQNPKLIVPSPDGRRLAYFQSDPGTDGIYTWDLATGRSERVTPAQEGVAYGAPAWSSDGKRIVFRELDEATNVGVLRIVDLSAGTSRTVPGLDARGLRTVDWSSDGSYILCNNDDKTTLDLVTVADGSTATLSDSVWSAQLASLSPDGRYVAYGAGPHTHERLYVQPVTGGPRQAIAESGGEMYLHPLWSPDGTAIAYQQNDGIWVRPMKDGAPSAPARLAYRTTAARWVSGWTEAGGLHFTALNQVNQPMEVEVDPRTARPAGAPPRELEGYPKLSSFRWSRDRGTVAANTWWTGYALYSFEAGTTRSFEDLEPEGVMIRGGVWSPDEREIWYEAMGMTPPASAGVKGLDVNTGAVRQVFPPLPGRARAITFSADGRTWAFLRPESDRSVSVVVAPAGQTDGQVAVRLNVPGQDRINSQALPHISPRGDQVFYVLQRVTPGNRMEPEAGSIWVVGADGTGARKVATEPAVESVLWDPTGRFVAYASRTMDRNTVLRVVEVATGAVHDLPVELTESGIQLNDWSADGRYIGFVQLKNWWEYWAVQGLLDQGGSR